MDLPNLRVWFIECWCCFLRAANTLFFFADFFIDFLIEPFSF